MMIPDRSGDRDLLRFVHILSLFVGFSYCLC